MSDDTLVAALARAQAVMPTITKSHTNPHFGSRYADIADVLAVIRPVLAAEGIALVQPIEVDEHGQAFLLTKLMKGTEEIVSRMPLQIDQKAQDLGSRLTYARRYCACALVGVAAEDDDDGHAASNAPPRTKTRQAAYEPRERSYVAERGEPASTPSAGPGRPSTDKQRKWANGLVKDLGWSPVEAAEVFTLLVQTDGLDTMTTAQASKVIDELTAIKKRERVVAWDDDGKPSIATVADLVADGTEPW